MTGNHSEQTTQRFEKGRLPDRKPLVDSLVDSHRAGPAHDDPSLITITHTPNAVTTHLVAAEPGAESAPVARMEPGTGRVITKLDTVEYGVLVSVMGGPAVVTVALHNTTTQRDAYLREVAEVDAETRRHTLDAVQGFALPIAVAVLQELGVQVGEQEDATEEQQ